MNLHKYGRVGQLLCHVWADSEWTEHQTLDDLGIVAAVVAGLRAIFPGRNDAGPLVTDPKQWKVTRWSEDPFACRILFAGEGAVPSGAGAQCTHGALLGGVSAAVEVLNEMELRDEEDESEFCAAHLL